MSGLWHHDRWKLEGNALLVPNGQHIPLKHIRQWIEDSYTGNADLWGHWAGWRIRQQYLFAPGQTHRTGTKITPATLRAFSRWVTGAETEHPQLRLF